MLTSRENPIETLARQMDEARNQAFVRDVRSAITRAAVRRDVERAGRVLATVLGLAVVVVCVWLVLTWGAGIR